MIILTIIRNPRLTVIVGLGFFVERMDLPKFDKYLPMK